MCRRHALRPGGQCACCSSADDTRQRAACKASSSRGLQRVCLLWPLDAKIEPQPCVNAHACATVASQGIRCTWQATATMASNRIVILTLAFAAVVTFYSLSELSKITSLEEHNQQRLSFEQANTPSPSSAKPISLDASALGKCACKSASQARLLLPRLDWACSVPVDNALPSVDTACKVFKCDSQIPSCLAAPERGLPSSVYAARLPKANSVAGRTTTGGSSGGGATSGSAVSTPSSDKKCYSYPHTE